MVGLVFLEQRRTAAVAAAAPLSGGPWSEERRARAGLLFISYFLV